MNDLTILHLSDLHIKGTDETLPEVLIRLLEDVKEQIIHIPDKTLVVAVTGDIIDKGNNGKPDSIENAKKFFDRLRNVLGEKVAGIVITPGNHDKFRDYKQQFLIPACRNGIKFDHLRFDSAFLEAYWGEIQASYAESGYMELTKYVYSLFDANINEEIINNTFGVVSYKINGFNFCFVLLNTAWCCVDDDDTRQIVLGEFQINMLCRQYQKIKESGQNPALTVCLGHHPLQCLDGNEETKILSALSDENKIMADAYLCGHMHNRTVINWNNNIRSLNTFMTGIGQEESEGDRVQAQYTRKRLYAFYVFNLDLNSIDIYSRGTNASLNFAPDFDLYTKDTEISDKKIVFPIDIQKTKAYITLYGGPDRSGKACYLSDKLLDSFRNYEDGIGAFRREMCNSLWQVKNQIYDEFPIGDNEDEDKALYMYLFYEDSKLGKSLVKRYSSEYADKFNEMFYCYLVELCETLRDSLTPEANKSAIRFHFRYLSDFERKEYAQLCISIPDEFNKDEMKMKPMQYGDLIKAAFEVGHGLIYRVNESFITVKPNSRWCNFITVIPNFDGNVYFCTEKRKKKRRKFPFLSFGISIVSEEMNGLLYYLNSYSIENIIGSVISDFLDYIPLDLKIFCEWANKTICKPDN